MSKRTKALGIHDPLRHQDHPRPRTRREFLAQSFITGSATVIGPSLLAMLAAPRTARATLAADIQSLLAPCSITTGAGKIPFICFDLAGGGNIAGSNVLVGGPNGQLDFLSVAGYSKLGLPGTMVPNPSTTGNFIDSTFGLQVSFGQRAPARHQDPRQDRLRDDQYLGYGDSCAVAERYQHESRTTRCTRFISTARAADCSI